MFRPAGRCTETCTRSHRLTLAACRDNRRLIGASLSTHLDQRAQLIFRYLARVRDRADKQFCFVLFYFIFPPKMSNHFFSVRTSSGLNTVGPTGRNRRFGRVNVRRSDCCALISAGTAANRQIKEVGQRNILGGNAAEKRATFHFRCLI